MQDKKKQAKTSNSYDDDNIPEIDLPQDLKTINPDNSPYRGTASPNQEEDM